MDWSVDVIGAMTNLIVQFSDLDCVDVDRVRDKLIDAFERLVDYAQTAAESDFSSMSKDMRDVYVDIVWIITQLVNGADAKEKADWERFVNTARERDSHRKFAPSDATGNAPLFEIGHARMCGHVDRT